MNLRFCGRMRSVDSGVVFAHSFLFHFLNQFGFIKNVGSPSIDWFDSFALLPTARIVSSNQIHMKSIVSELIVNIYMWAHFNSACNFIIYGMTHRGFRSAYMELLNRVVPCCEIKLKRVVAPTDGNHFLSKAQIQK